MVKSWLTCHVVMGTKTCWRNWMNCLPVCSMIMSLKVLRIGKYMLLLHLFIVERMLSSVPMHKLGRFEECEGCRGEPVS